MASKGGKSTFIMPADASRIQSAAAKAGGGGVAKGSFAARAQSAAAKNANAAWEARLADEVPRHTTYMTVHCKQCCVLVQDGGVVAVRVGP
jgi:hypothetical protein